MTFNEFVTAAEALKPDNNRSLFVEVSHKSYSFQSEREISFEIWDSHLSRNFDSPTPEETLALYRAALGTPAQ